MRLPFERLARSCLCVLLLPCRSGLAQALDDAHSVGSASQSNAQAIEKAFERDRWDLGDVEVLVFSEPVDEPWASDREKYLAARIEDSKLAELAGLEIQIECRTTACRIYAILTSGDEALQSRVFGSLSDIQTKVLLDSNDGLRPLGVAVWPREAPRYPMIVHFLIRDESLEPWRAE